MTEQEALTSLAEIADTITTRSKGEIDFCGIYKLIKEPLKQAVNWIEQQPGWGKPLAVILRFLMRLAEACCAKHATI